MLSVNGATRAPLLRGSGTATLVFGYTVQAGDTDTNGIWIGPSDRTREGARNGEPRTGTITSVATDLAADLTHGEVGTQSGHKVNGSLTPPDTNTAPVITTTSPLETPGERDRGGDRGGGPDGDGHDHGRRRAGLPAEMVRRLSGHSPRVGASDVLDGRSAVSVVRHSDEFRDAGVMERG